MQRFGGPFGPPFFLTVKNLTVFLRNFVICHKTGGEGLLDNPQEKL